MTRKTSSLDDAKAFSRLSKAAAQASKKLRPHIPAPIVTWRQRIASIRDVGVCVHLTPLRWRLYYHPASNPYIRGMSFLQMGPIRLCWYRS